MSHLQEKERKEKKNESEQKKENDKKKKDNKEEKNKKVSAFAKKIEVESVLMTREQLVVLIFKDVYFTNDLNSSLPCEVVSLLQRFVDVFLEKIPYGLPPLRGIEHQIDFIPGVRHFQIGQSIGQVQTKLMSSCKKDL